MTVFFFSEVVADCPNNMEFAYGSDTGSELPSRSDNGSPFEPGQQQQNFEFVNFDSSTPSLKDPDQRKLIRAHVVRDWSRRKKLHRLETDKLKGRKIQPSSSTSASSSATQSNTQLSECFHVQQNTQRAVEVLRRSTPITETTTPHVKEEDPGTQVENVSPILDWDSEASFQQTSATNFHSLLVGQPNLRGSPFPNHLREVGLAMFPLSSIFKFNPIAPVGCGNWHKEDEAAYHGALYALSTYANLISGQPESRGATVTLSKVVTMINGRLKEISDSGKTESVAEGLIGAVASISLAESLKGNTEGWKIHMKGAKHLSTLKGGLSSLSVNLRHKLYRADLHGAVGTFSSPFFTGEDGPLRIFQSSGAPLPSTPTSLAHVRLNATLIALPITQGLRSTLSGLLTLSKTISEEISTRRECSHMKQEQMLDQNYQIQYALLRPWSENEWNDEVHQVDECLRIAGLLYLHATWQDFPFSALRVTKILARYKELLCEVDVIGDVDENLMLWLFFIGAISTNKNDKRLWFIAHLQRLVGTLQLDSWEIVETKLELFWWVRRIHGNLCKSVWDEVVVLNSVLAGI